MTEASKTKLAVIVWHLQRLERLHVKVKRLKVDKQTYVAMWSHALTTQIGGDSQLCFYGIEVVMRDA